MDIRAADDRQRVHLRRCHALECQGNRLVSMKMRKIV
jgi:hypothetical protein